MGNVGKELYKGELVFARRSIQRKELIDRGECYSQGNHCTTLFSLISLGSTPNLESFWKEVSFSALSDTSLVDSHRFSPLASLPVVSLRISSTIRSPRLFHLVSHSLSSHLRTLASSSDSIMRIDHLRLYLLRMALLQLVLNRSQSVHLLPTRLRRRTARDLHRRVQSSTTINLRRNRNRILLLKALPPLLPFPPTHRQTQLVHSSRVIVFNNSLLRPIRLDQRILPLLLRSINPLSNNETVHLRCPQLYLPPSRTNRYSVTLKK